MVLKIGDTANVYTLGKTETSSQYIKSRSNEKYKMYSNICKFVMLSL